MNDKIINKPTVKTVLSFDFSTLLLLRCLERDYAKKFCSGEIYFGTPRKWVQIGEKGRIGQGDFLEGVFFSTKEDNRSNFINDLKNDTTIEYFNDKGLTFFRKKPILDLHCLCLYGLHNKSFNKQISEAGRAHYHSTVNKDYFKDFSNYSTREEWKRVPYLKQPVVVLITDPKEFFKRLVSALTKLDIKESEIVISPVEYIDRYIPAFTNIPYPMELLLKDSAFDSQSEVRVIINSSSPKYLDYMRSNRNTIEIGSLEDITEIYDYYFDDMMIEKFGNRKALISLPESKIRSIYDMSFFELRALVNNILLGTVKLENVPEKSKTWQEKLKLISDVLYSKYGVLLHIDEEKRITFLNTPSDICELMRTMYQNSPNKVIDDYANNITNLIDNSHLDDAIDQCQKNRNNKLLSGVSAYYLGKIYSIENKEQEAISSFRQSFNCDYKPIESLNGIASIYFHSGNYQKAKETYFEIQDEKGYDGSIYYNIGLCCYHLKQYKEAITYFDKGIELNQNDAALYYNKGVSYYALGQYDKAKKFMKKAIELDSTNEFYKHEFNKCF